MRSLQMTGPGVVEIVASPMPECTPDDVLIHMQACTICNQHDRAVFAGTPHGGPRQYPLEPGFPGHEGAGIVVQVGANVADLAVGDHVVTTGIGGPPLYSEYVTRRRGTAVKIPDQIPFAHAAPLELFGCVHHAFAMTSSVAGRRVGVVGLGPGGQAAVALAKALGAGEVVAFDLDASRLDTARRMGATSTIDASRFSSAWPTIKRMFCEFSPPSAPDTKAIIEDLMAHQCDVLFECSGHPRSMETSFLLARQEITVFGYVPQPVECIPAIWYENELIIRNSKILNLDDLRAVTTLLAQGRIDTSPIVTHVMPFAQYAEAIHLIATGRAIKIALVWE